MAKHINQPILNKLHSKYSIKMSDNLQTYLT